MTKDEDGMFKCPCGHHAPAKWNVKRHMEGCKVVKAAALNVDKAAVAELKASLEAKEALLTAAKARVEQQAEEIASLKAENKELKARPSSTVTNNITNINIVNLAPIQMYHRALRKVMNVSLDEELLPSKTSVQPLLSEPETAVSKFVELKYFTGVAMPSIRMPNVKKPELLVVERDKDGTNRWATADKNETIGWLVEKSYDELADHYEAKREPAYARWTQRECLDAPGFDQTPAFKKMKKDVESMIIQHRKR